MQQQQNGQKLFRSAIFLKHFFNNMSENLADILSFENLRTTCTFKQLRQDSENQTKQLTWNRAHLRIHCSRHRCLHQEQQTSRPCWSPLAGNQKWCTTILQDCTNMKMCMKYVSKKKNNFLTQQHGSRSLPAFSPWQKGPIWDTGWKSPYTHNSWPLATVWLTDEH